MMQRALHIILSEMTHESRVNKECKTLREQLGMEPVVFAMHEEGLSPDEKREFMTVRRFPLKTRSWPKIKPVQLLKYAECRMRMVAGAVELGPRLVHAHSLGALPIGARIAARLRIPLVYDAHEFETDVDGLAASPLNKRFRQITESKYIRRVDAVLCVSESIAVEYAGLYRIKKPCVVLNCPPYQDVRKKDLFRHHFQIPAGRRIFLYQGLLSVGRGLPQLLELFSSIKDIPADLVLMGYGPMAEEVSGFAGRCERIHFKEAVPPDELLAWTASADIGISTIENTCLSYYYCLPNKVFEYMMAGLPVICSDLPEMRKLVNGNGVGWLVEDNSVEGIGKAVLSCMERQLSPVRSNVKKAATIYNWEVQEKKLVEIYRDLKI